MEIENKDLKNNEGWFQKNHPSFYAIIIDLPIDKPFREKLYLYFNKTEAPICYCGNPTAFINVNKGYRIYCSTKCQANDKYIRDKSKNTCIKKYGVGNPMQNEKIKEKLNSVILEKYIFHSYRLESSNPLLYTKHLVVSQFKNK